MNNLNTFIITLVAGFATMIGNIFLFIRIKDKNKIISFTMGLAFSVMLLLSLLELIPEGIILLNSRYNYFQIFIIGFIFLYLGYLIVMVSERYIKEGDSLYKIGFLSMICLLLHNIPEGIICSITSSRNIDLGIKMCLLIMLHNIPEGICISLPIYYSTKSRGKALLYSFISSLGEVIGALLSIFIFNNYIDDLLLGIILIFTAGIMISLSVIKILKEGMSYKCFKWLFRGVLIGIGIILLSV